MILPMNIISKKMKPYYYSNMGGFVILMTDWTLSGLNFATLKPGVETKKINIFSLDKYSKL